MKENRKELLKELREAELERIDLDFRGSQEVSREEYKKAYDKEMALKKKLYGSDVHDITKDEIIDFLLGVR